MAGVCIYMSAVCVCILVDYVLSLVPDPAVLTRLSVYREIFYPCLW